MHQRHKTLHSLCPSNLSPRNVSQGNSFLGERGENLECTKTLLVELFIMLESQEPPVSGRQGVELVIVR